MFFYRDLRYYYTTLRKQLHFRPIAPYIPSLKWQGFTAHFDNFLVIFFVSQLKFYTKPRTFYSPGFHFFVEKEPLLIATALFLMNFLIIDLFADKQAACKNS